MKNIMNKKTIRNFFIDKKQQWILFLVTFFIHESLVVLLNSELIKLPIDIVDHFSYHNLASEISNLLNNGNYTWGAVYYYHWYPVFIAVLYSFFGKSILLATSINAVLVSFSSVLFFEIANSIGRKIYEKIIFWGTLIIFNGYISLMLNTSLLLREAWIIFLVLVILYFSLKMFSLQKISWKHFFVILLAFLLLRNLRFFVGFAIIVGFFASWFFENNLILKKRIVYGLIMIFLVSGTTFFLTGEGLGKSLSFIQYINPQFIREIRSNYFDQRGITKINSQETVVVDTINKKTSFNFLGIARSFNDIVFGPFPGQISFKKYLMALPEILLWYLILAFSFVGFYFKRINKPLLFFIPSVIIISGLVLSVNNFGALFRYRMPLVILLSFFALFGFILLLEIFSKNKNHENTLYHN